MKKGFYTIIAAQFVSSLADNALLIAAIALLRDIHAEPWVTPLLQILFTISYIVLAPFVGAFADAMQKRHVMFVSNALKACGCVLMLANVHPMLAYGLIGFGAAAYSPAKYGILTELLPARQLVAANAWLESATVLSTIVGTMAGGALVSQGVAQWLSAHTVPLVHTAAQCAMAVMFLVYALAGVLNIDIPDTGARYENRLREPLKLVRDFRHCFYVLWHDKLAQIALWVTTLLWGSAVTLQLIVLKWANVRLGMSLSAAATLQGVTGLGIAAGAAWAAARVPMRDAFKVLPVGPLVGAVTICMAFYSRGLFPEGAAWRIGALHLPYYLVFAFVEMLVVGGLAGFFVVPMNAVLQHRGAQLLSAGHSIAVQNFNQNIAVLVMLGLYALLLKIDLPIQWIIVLFGTSVVVLMVWAIVRHASNQREHDHVEAVLGE
ncbi:lysophospholipid transporter LplT [Pararobbsia silviterrae]|uniref:Lysophospholipid transporter LplT n=1 Tax=Pararobbsia silviterrae TaxID=1792498 RepID=A0A494XY37_9BURK|nr:lysophospholipid transporter LplT [Pararobbsia silviterrae]RKP54855.1 lysophospholipid transporter LplT [Pararobbsia silviterrae]